MANYGDLIHAAIMDAIMGHDFKSVDYPDSKTRETLGTRLVKPKTVKIDQRSAAFTPSTRNRQTRFNERSSWTWTADVHFNRAVSLEELEDDLAQNPRRISRNASDGRPQQVDIFLEEAEEYAHPPRRSSSTGTRVRYRFVAELSPL